MKSTLLPVSIALTALLLAPAWRDLPAADGQEKEKGVPVYTVDKYDPDRDPDEDLAATVKLAEAEGKRILIQVGGDWCGWCRKMSLFFHENEAVAGILARDYLIMKVNYSGTNVNDDFLDRYPEINAFPHLFVLDEKGKLLRSQDTEEFEKRGSYSEGKLAGFLRKWAPRGSS